MSVRRCKRITKPKSSAWNYFNKVTESDEKDENLSLEKYQCVYCEARYAGHATRLTKHLSRGCRKCPKSVAKEFTSLLKYKIEEKVENKKSSNNCTKLNKNVLPKNDQEDISNISFVDWKPPVSLNRYAFTSTPVPHKLEKTTQEETEKLYARAFYSGGVPLNFTENEYWQEFLHYLEPGFQIPSKSKLSHQLLQREYKNIEEKIREKVEATPILGLQCSVTLNKKRNFEVNFMLNVPKSLFHKTVTLQSKDEVSYHLENEIMSIMDQFGPKKFLILIADDISVLEATQIMAIDSPDMVRYFCGVQSLTLFIEDIFKLETASSLLTYTRTVVQEINKNVLETSISLKIPSEKCWKSVFTCFKCLPENEKYLKHFAADQSTSTLTKEIRSLLLDNSYWSKLKNLILVLEPIFKWMHDISNDLSISHVVNCFCELAVHVESLSKINLFKPSELKKIRQSLAHKRDMTLTPLHFAANILDPKFNGIHLTDIEQIQGSEYVDKISNIVYENDGNSSKEVLCEMAKYRCQEGIFSVSYVTKTSGYLSPDLWWKGSCYGLKLSKVANIILSMPASVVQIENLDVTYIAKINTLNEELTNRYIYAYKNLRLMQSYHSDNSTPIQVERAIKEENENNVEHVSEDDISEVEYELSLDE